MEVMGVVPSKSDELPLKPETFSPGLTLRSMS